MIARRRLLLSLVCLLLAGLPFALAGYPRNPVADRIVSALLSRSLGLPVACEGARIEDATRRLAFDRLVIGGPDGYGREPMATLESGALGLARVSLLGRRAAGIEARRLEALVVVAGDGSNSLEVALMGAGSTIEPADLHVSVADLDVAVLDVRTGVRNWIRDATLRVSGVERTVEFAGRVETDVAAGSFDVRAELADDRLGLAVAAHGFELAAISPAIMPWFGGGSLSGGCDFEFDLAWSRGTRLAISGSGELRQPAFLVRRWSPAAAIGESVIRLNGGFELDPVARRLRADSLRVESEVLHLAVNGERSLDGGSNSAAIEGVAVVGFDQAVRRYGPLYSRALRACGVSSLVGAIDLRFGGAAMLSGEASLAGLPVAGTTEGFACSLADGRAFQIGDSTFECALSGSAAELRASDLRVGAAFCSLRGAASIVRPFEPGRDFRCELEGELFTHRLVDPIVALAGSMPLFLNGEGRLALVLNGVTPVLEGRVVYESDDTDVRFDDLRPGVADVWNFRGKPYRVEAEFRAPTASEFDLGSLVVSGRIDARRAEIVRDVLTDFELPFALRERRLTLGPFTGGYFDGRLTGEIDVVLPPQAAASVHARIECVEARLLHFTAHVGALATGVLAGPFAPLRTSGDNRVSGWLEVDGAGDSMSAVVRSLRGNGAIEIGPGTVRGSAFLDAWLPPDPRVEGGRTIDSLRAPFFLESGVLVSNDVELTAAGRRLRLSGRASAPGVVDYAIAPADFLPAALASRVGARLDPRAISIRGPIDQPVLTLPDVSTWERLDDDALAAALAEFSRR